jgi:hypothetical protein
MANRVAKGDPAGAYGPSDKPHCFADTHGVLVTTTNDLPGYRIVKVLGTVYGLSVRAGNAASILWSTAKAMKGGELKVSYFCAWLSTRGVAPD